jgi:hypothetical protein
LSALQARAGQNNAETPSRRDPKALSFITWRLQDLVETEDHSEEVAGEQQP